MGGKATELLKVNKVHLTESMIVEYGQQAYDADLKGVRVENSGGRIADVVEKKRRIRNHMHSKQQKRRKVTITSMYVYNMMVDIDARTGV